MLVKSSRYIAAAGLIFAGALVAEVAEAADIFTLKSTTFEDGKMMPKQVANGKANLPSNPNCVGENVSPQLSWSGVPQGTRSFVIMLVDPEARGGMGFDQWIAYGIPGSVNGFAEGEVSKPSDKYVGGKNSLGVGFYSGPCTPPGTTPHHYTFVLIATDLDPKELPPGLTKAELLDKLSVPPASHVKGSTGLVGLFVNPWHE